jgi:MYXO-CTERM domain-containing protein
MSTTNQDPQPASNMEALKQQSEACGAGCACHAAAPPGRTRWVLGALVLMVAAALVVRAVVKTTASTTQRATAAMAAFAAPAGAGQAVAARPAGAPALEQAACAAAATAVTAADSVAAAPPAATTTAPVGAAIAAFAELNTLAADTTAVFVFVPARQPDSTPPPKAQMEAAARTIAAPGDNTVGLFSLTPGSADYEQIVGQVAVPGVLALVKGRGMQAVSGDITETKLVQAFVAASSAGGACGAGSSSCAPGTPGCK